MRKREFKSLPSVPEQELCADGIALPDPCGATVSAAVEPGVLSLVSLPIGCIEDISIRALNTLRSVSVIAAERPSITRSFLSHYEIETPIEGLGRRNQRKTITALVDQLRSGASVALVCDAGTPLIADAGHELTSVAHRAGVTIRSVPGPCAAIAALILSNAACGRFAFDGFPPRTTSDRPAFFHSLAGERRTIVLYETRAYLRDTLQRLRDSLGSDTNVFVARDLTKPTEAHFHGSLSDAATRFLDPPRGEYVLVVSPSTRLQ